jgi:heat shock protein HslJ
MTRSLALIALPLLAACTTVGNAAPPLVPSEWRFVSIDGQAPVSGQARLKIETGRIGANVGCNGMGGDLRIEGAKLVTGPIISTRMFCEGLMEQERAVSELLGASPRFTYSGDRLVLKSDKHRAELKRQQP